jgi:hypothetical protein
MGIFTYVKIGLAVAVLAILGYFVLEYRHRGTVIETQKNEIANLKVEKTVFEAKQKVYEEFMAKKPVIQKRVTHEKEQIDQAVNTVDDAGLRALYDRYRMLTGSEIHVTPNGPSGRAKPAPRGSPPGH